MVQDGEIALTIIEGTLVALPLWLAVVRYGVSDVAMTETGSDPSKFDEYTTLLMVGAVTGIGFLSLLTAFAIAAGVATGAGGDIELALVLVGVFIFAAGFQLSAGLVTRVSEMYGRRQEALVAFGLIGGLVLLVWIVSFL